MAYFDHNISNNRDLFMVRLGLVSWGLVKLEEEKLSKIRLD